MPFTIAIAFGIMSIHDRFIPTNFRRQHVSSDKEWWKRAREGFPCWPSGWDAVLLLQGMQVPSLARELRSHMPQGQKKKKNDGIPSKGLHTASLLLNVGEIICFSRGPQMVYLYDFAFLIHVSSPPEPLFLWILII